MASMSFLLDITCVCYLTRFLQAGKDWLMPPEGRLCPAQGQEVAHVFGVWAGSADHAGDFEDTREPGELRVVYDELEAGVADGAMADVFVAVNVRAEVLFGVI